MINTTTAQKIRVYGTQSKILQLAITSDSNKTAYGPGDRIEGLVTIQAPHTADIDISNLSVKLTGTYISTDAKSSALVVDRFLSRTDAALEHRLFQTNKLVKRSTQATFIFSINLPHDLGLSSTSSSDSRVVYTLSAELGSLKSSAPRPFGALHNSSWRICVSGGHRKAISSWPICISKEITVFAIPLSSFDDCRTLFDESMDHTFVKQEVAT